MLDTEKYPVLSKVEFPKDIRELDILQLKQLCTDIREYLIDTISEIGGHFGGGLGTVELTVALHKVFNTPYDQIVWDTGHQAYPHKILTGRKDKLGTIRRLNGISGFLKRLESEYDTFGAGHASTSISAVLGMAVARDIKKESRKIIAIIFLDSFFISRATAIPSTAEIDVEACPAPKVSYSLSNLLRNPLMPLSLLMVPNLSFLPVNIL